MAYNKVKRRAKIRKKIRSKISGTAERPRLAVFRSNKSIYAQLIDDLKGMTLVAASSKEIEDSEELKTKVDVSAAVGKLLAQKAEAKGINTAVFDRSGYLYHGRVKALGDGAREGGLKF